MNLTNRYCIAEFIMYMLSKSTLSELIYKGDIKDD